MSKKITLSLLLILLLCSPLWAQDIQEKNHFKTWRVTSVEPSRTAQVRDQFMTDFLQLGPLEFLSNPTAKFHDPNFYPIVDSLHHLDWYRAFGRDTLISLEYVNQFESTKVEIDSVYYLLVPAQKLPHNPPFGLDHYKAYRIRNPLGLDIPVQLQDQFDLQNPPPANFEQILSIRQAYFLTPCSKNGEAMIDTFTHYVAYFIDPLGSTTVTGVTTQDQFGPHSLSIMRSELLLVPTKKKLQPPPPPPPTGPNHYKVWMLQTQGFGELVQAKDQFMTDNLDLNSISFLSNPVMKIVPSATGFDTSYIVDPDDHLTWYGAVGRDTLLQVEYRNQFEQDTVLIDRVNWLLVPTTKNPHPPYDSLDHYKCYYIRNPEWLKRQAFLQDQFDVPDFERVDSLLPVYFCTPCQKTRIGQPPDTVFDTLTHYVAYYAALPPKTAPPRATNDQFGPHTMNFIGPWGLLVPTEKIKFGPPPPPPSDTLKNHYKTWRIDPQTFDRTVFVQDQLRRDSLRLIQIEYLSNPSMKIVLSATGPADTFDIVDPDDHLTWYRVAPRKRTLHRIVYENQFESTGVVIDSTKYLLLPTQKLIPNNHPPFDSLDHYRLYRIKKPKTLFKPILLQDQFDLMTPVPFEQIDSLIPRYLCTPAIKNNEVRYDTLTHYVAYEIFQKSQHIMSVLTQDQFGQHTMQTRQSEYLLVPTDKLCVRKLHLVGDLSLDDNLSPADVVHMINVVFKNFPLPPGVDPCQADVNNSGGPPSPADVVTLLNHVFKNKPLPWEECGPPC